MDNLDEYVGTIRQLASGLDALWITDVDWSDSPSVSNIIRAIDDAGDVSEGDWVRVIEQLKSDDLKKFLTVYIATKSRRRAEASVSAVLGYANSSDEAPPYQRVLAFSALIFFAIWVYSTLNP